MEYETEFEREIRAALARVQAPEGFGERVHARTRKQRARPLARITTPAWRGAYAAAALLALIAGSMHVHRVHEQERRSTEAQQQFAKAMDITDHALDRVSVQLQRGQFGQLTGVLQNGREQ